MCIRDSPYPIPGQTRRSKLGEMEVNLVQWCGKLPEISARHSCLYLESVYVEVARCLHDANCNQRPNQRVANVFLRLKRIIRLDTKWCESHCATALHLNEKGTEKQKRLSLWGGRVFLVKTTRSFCLFARDKRAGKMHPDASSLTRSTNTPVRA